MTEMFVQLKLGDQRYKSKVSSVNETRRILSFQVIKIKVFPLDISQERSQLIFRLSLAMLSSIPENKQLYRLIKLI